MKLILHADDLWERDWLRFLFGDVIDSVIYDLDLTCFDDDSIHVVSNNKMPLIKYEEYFRACRAKCKHIVLVHVSDELFSGGYKTYQYFDYVFRWNHTYLADAPGIMTIPLGATNNSGFSDKLASDRKYAWSFIGHVKTSRVAMINAFDNFEPKYLLRTESLFKQGGKKVSKDEFDAILGESVFSPCPMGNATLDTHRVYESLDMGAIPIVELRPTMDYYTNLFGPNPIPTFRSWKEARKFCEEIFQDKTELLRLQNKVLGWWYDYKKTVQANVQAAATGPSQAKNLQRYANLLRNRKSAVHESLRIIELLRHQTANSLMHRMGNPIGPLKRIVWDNSV